MEFDLNTLIPLVPNLAIAIWVIRLLTQIIERQMAHEKWLIERLTVAPEIPPANNQEETD